MGRMKPLAALAAMVLMLASCGQDVVIDVDTLPTGNAAGDAASGVFSYAEVVSRSDCPATAGGVTLPAEGVPYSATVTLSQGDGYLRMDFPAGSSRPVHYFEGGIFWHGNFRIGGTYYYGGGMAATFINLVDGRFTEGVDNFEGTTKVRVTAADADCELTVDFTGTRGG